MPSDDQDRMLRWRRRKDARPSEILNAALACFTERGFAATRLEDVARCAGVTKGTLYLYFRNKEELFEAVVRQSLVPYIEGLEAAVGSATEPVPVLLKRLITGWPEVIASPESAIPKLVIAEAGNFPELARFYLNEVVHRSMAVIRQVIRTGIDRGEFRQVDVEATVMCVIAPVIFSMLWRHSLGLYEPTGRDPQTLCDTCLQLLLNGLADGRPAIGEAKTAALDQEEATR
jgi:AcrR family transcriptional regulator